MSGNLLRPIPHDDRRRHPRYGAVGIEGTINGEHPLSVVKISLGGLMTRVRYEPSFNEVARIELSLGRISFRSLARIVYAGPDMASPGNQDGYFRVGLAFVDTSPEQQLRLERFIVREYPEHS